jgi:hypothetical protein
MVTPISGFPTLTLIALYLGKKIAEMSSRGRFTILGLFVALLSAFR